MNERDERWNRTIAAATTFKKTEWREGKTEATDDEEHEVNPTELLFEAVCREYDQYLKAKTRIYVTPMLFKSVE